MSAAAAPLRLWLIGCGNMAGAMLRRWVASGTVVAADVFVVNRADRALPDNVRQGRALPDEPAPDIVVLGVKPQQLDAVAAQYAKRLAAAPILLSMLAGVGAAVLARRFPGPVPVPCMPNLPVEYGHGVVAVHAPDAPAAARAAVDRLLAPLGWVHWFDDAARYAAAGAVSGTGPAFLFRFVDALAAAGDSLGLASDEAAEVARATVVGAAAMVGAETRSPAALADAVASPGGMTRAGLDVLDADTRLRRLMEETLAAVTRRGREMAAAAD